MGLSLFEIYVDRTGIEPVTPTMSMWCSTAEPTILAKLEIIPQENKAKSARVVVLNTLDVIFTKVSARLYFYKNHSLCANIF